MSNLRFPSPRLKTASIRLSRRCRRLDAAGTAAVEFALGALAYIGALAAIIELGWYAHAAQVLHNAARQGARAAVRTENSNAEVIAAVQQAIAPHSTIVAPQDVTVTIEKLNSQGAAEYTVQSLDENEQGEAVRVTVSISYSAISPLLLEVDGIELEVYAVMQREEG